MATHNRHHQNRGWSRSASSQPPSCVRISRRCRLTGAFHRHVSSPTLSPFSRCHLPPPSPGAPPQAVQQKRRAELERALGLSRSRVRALAVHRLDSATKLVISPRTLQRSSVSLAPALTYTSPLVAPPHLRFPPLPRIEPPQTTTRRDGTSFVACARELSSSTLFFVCNGKAGAFSTLLVQHLERPSFVDFGHRCQRSQFWEVSL